MEQQASIPGQVIGALAHSLDRQYSRPEIVSLFMRAGAPGSDPYVSNKKQMITDWLAATNRESPDPLAVLGVILDDFFNGIVNGKNPDTLSSDRQLVHERMRNCGLSLHKGRAVLVSSATADEAPFLSGGIRTVEVYPATPPRAKETPAATQTPKNPARTDVMVIHGRNSAARRAMFDFLRALGLNPLEWEDIVRRTGNASPYSGDAAREAISSATAVVVLLTGDDVASLRPAFWAADEGEDEKRLLGQARPNVLVEFGMALMADPAKVVIVELEKTRNISDTFGRNAVRYKKNDAEFRHIITNRLETAGCEVRKHGTDWLSAGDFASSIQYDHSTVEELGRSDDAATANHSPAAVADEASTRPSLWVYTPGEHSVQGGPAAVTIYSSVRNEGSATVRDFTVRFVWPVSRAQYPLEGWTVGGPFAEPFIERHFAQPIYPGQTVALPPMLVSTGPNGFSTREIRWSIVSEIGRVPNEEDGYLPLTTLSASNDSATKPKS